jgi:hypothetical protein
MAQDMLSELTDRIRRATEGLDDRDAKQMAETTRAGEALMDVITIGQELERLVERVPDIIPDAGSDVTNGVTQKSLDRLRNVVANQPASNQREDLLGVIDDTDPSAINDRQFEQIITAAKSLPQEKQEMTQPHEFAKSGHLPDAY